MANSIELTTESGAAMNKALYEHIEHFILPYLIKWRVVKRITKPRNVVHVVEREAIVNVPSAVLSASFKDVENLRRFVLEYLKLPEESECTATPLRADLWKSHDVKPLIFRAREAVR